MIQPDTSAWSNLMHRPLIQYCNSLEPELYEGVPIHFEKAVKARAEHRSIEAFRYLKRAWEDDPFLFHRRMQSACVNPVDGYQSYEGQLWTACWAELGKLSGTSPEAAGLEHWFKETPSALLLIAPEIAPPGRRGGLVRGVIGGTTQFRPVTVTPPRPVWGPSSSPVGIRKPGTSQQVQWTRFDVTIGPDGIPTQALVGFGQVESAQAELATCFQWRFSPTLYNGVPVYDKVFIWIGDCGPVIGPKEQVAFMETPPDYGCERFIPMD